MFSRTARLGALLVLSLLALPATAQTAPAPAPVPSPAPPAPTRLVGGCNATGTICAGPSVTLTMSAYDFTNHQVIGSFSPGLGYGVTFNQGKWSAFGVDAYVSLQSGPTQGMTTSLMLKFANGWGRIGVAWMALGAQHSWLMPIGLGFDL